jgi:hypothetical protein
MIANGKGALNVKKIANLEAIRDNSTSGTVKEGEL